MHHRWEALSFLHWPVAADAVQRRLPAGLEVDTFDGSAWIGLVPFWLHVRMPRVPYVPWAACFAETNVRTYVRGPDGEPGIWFFSLDAARSARCSRPGGGSACPTRGRAPGSARPSAACSTPAGGAGHHHGAARCGLWIEPGARLEPAEIDELDDFLTRRWRLYCVLRDRVHIIEAEHEPWPLHAASVRHLDDELIAATGFDVGPTPVRALYSPRVDVRLSRATAC